MRKRNKIHPLKLLAASGYILGVTSLAIAMVLGFTPATTTYGQVSISCPISSGTIVNISNGPFIRSDRSEAQAQIGPLSASMPAGTYSITLVSYDDHASHTGPDQPQERWVLILLDSGGAEITRSHPIADLPGADDWLTQQTNGNLVVSSPIASVVAYHAAYPNTDSPNSIVPVCASLVALQVEPTPTPIPPTDIPPTDIPPTDIPPTDPPEPTATTVPPTEPPDPTDVPPTEPPDPTDPAPTSIPPTRVPPTNVPPPEPTSPAVLIPVTGLDFNLSAGMMNKLFNDLGIALLGFGFLMHGAWLHFGKEE